MMSSTTGLRGLMKVMTYMNLEECLSIDGVVLKNSSTLNIECDFKNQSTFAFSLLK